MSIQQKDGFKNLDDKLQDFIQQYAKGCRKLDDLIRNEATAIKMGFSIEGVKITNQISVQLRAQEQCRGTMEECAKLHGSLQFSTMAARKSRIGESHSSTFQWVFDDKIDAEWASFSKWLKSDERIFWFSGKAGSGKSTLIKFLTKDPRTKECLAQWKPNADVISFFLWNAVTGSYEQRSIQGTLCALLYQVLSLSNDLIIRLISEEPTLKMKSNYNDWSEDELKTVLIKSLTLLPRPLCIFLDGLDEIDRKTDGEDKIVQLVKTLLAETPAKLCVSSRPETLLEQAFCNYPMIQLQDLTKSDIASYVQDYLRDHFQYLKATKENENVRQAIISIVIKKANGVFLWVYLVLNSLRRGNVKKDNYDLLLKRITDRPDTLTELYKESWDRQEDAALYRTEGARYFKFILEASREPCSGIIDTPFSLLELAIASDNSLQKTILEEGSFPAISSLIDKAGSFGKRVETCCGGLVEVWSHDPRPSNADGFGTYMETVTSNIFSQFIMPLSYYRSQQEEPRSVPCGAELVKLWKVSYHDRLGFIHRTAADFMLETQWGNSLLLSDPTPTIDIQLGLCRAQMAHILLFGTPWYQERNGYAQMSRDVDDLLKILRDIYTGVNMAGEWEQKLSLAELIYERMVDRIWVIDGLITELRQQIQAGQFEEPEYRTMREFIACYALYILKGLYTPKSILLKKSELMINSESQIIHKVETFCDLCLRIYNNCSDDTSDPLVNIQWPEAIPKFPILRRQSSVPDDRLGVIFADMFFTFWVQIDARNFLRLNGTKMISSFLRTVAKMGLDETMSRCFKRRKGFYENVQSLRERLLFSTSKWAVSNQDNNCPEWKWDSTIQFLLESGADPKWIEPPLKRPYYQHQAITSFELFLLSAPAICLSSADTSTVDRISRSIRSYARAGVDLERIVYVCLDVSSLTWRFAECDKETDYSHKVEITVEKNVLQLLKDFLSFMQHNYPEYSPEALGELEDLDGGPRQAYRKALMVTKLQEEDRALRCFGISQDDSDRVLELLDANADAKELSSAGRSIETEMKDLAERICTAGVELDRNSFLRERGHVFGRKNADICTYMENNVEKCFRELFPDLERDESFARIEDKDVEGSARGW
jgi:hypothetical protein